MSQPPQQQQPPPAYGAYPPGYNQPPPGYPPGYNQPIYQQPPPGYNPANMFMTQQSQQVVVVNSNNARVYPPGTCHRCGGHISTNFTMLGIILCILFFPTGLLCCLLMTEKRCDNCG